MDPRILELQAHIAELDAFLGSRIHRGAEAARLAKLAAVETEILEVEITDAESVHDLVDLKGQRKLLLDLANQFEDVRETLKEQLAEIEQAAETKDAANQTKTDDEIRSTEADGLL